MADPDLHFDESEITPELIEYNNIEQLIFSLNIENINETIPKLLKSNVSVNYIAEVINLAATITRFHFPLYKRLFQSLGSKVPPFPQSLFITYLSVSKVLPKMKVLGTNIGGLTLKEMEEVFEDDSFEKIVQNDNIESFMRQVPGTECPSLEFKLDKSKISPANLAAYCGSLNIFKFLCINGVEFDSETAKYCVKGGNREIIELAYQRGLSFNNTLTEAIMHHHYQIANWILDNFENAPFTMEDAIISCSSVAMSSVLKSGKFSFSNKAVFRSIQFEIMPLLMMILEEKDFDIEMKSPAGFTPAIQAIYANCPIALELLLKRNPSLESKIFTLDSIIKSQEVQDLIQGYLETHKKTTKKRSRRA